METIKRNRRISLLTKFNLLTISLIIFTSICITVYVLQTETANNYSELINHGRSLASMLVQNSEYGIYTEDSKSLQQIVKSIEADPNIAYINIFNREKDCLVQKKNDTNVNVPLTLKNRDLAPANGIIIKEFIEEQSGNSYIDILAPVLTVSQTDPVEMLEMGEKLSQPKIIGYIQLGLTQEKIKNHLRKFLLSTVIFTSMFTMIGILLTILLTKKIISPIRNLSSVAEDISEGNLNREISITTNDEISDLSRAFNHMLVRLRNYRSEAEGRNSELQAINQIMQVEINERKSAEEALASEKENLAITLRSIGDGVITTNIEGTIILLNNAASELTGWDYQEAQGKDLSEVFHIVQPSTAYNWWSIAKKVFESGGQIDLGKNIKILSRNGMHRIVDLRCAPVRHRAGNIIGVIIVFRDVTELKKTEEEIMQNKLDSIGVLAGGIAHDFNNLLTAIMGNVSSAKIKLERNLSREKIFERLNETEKATMRARDLTQQLLTFAKGGTPVKKISDIKEIIRDATRFAIRGSNAKCELSIEEDLAAADVDIGQISQVINNITLNGVQAMPEGGTIKVFAGNIEASSETDLPMGQMGNEKYIKISIQDHGTGISEKHLKKIFDPYFTTKQQGSGLGLASSYSIVKKHDGIIKVESKMGEGTVFHIYLPASSNEITQANHQELCQSKGKGKLLIMDDEEIIRNCLSDMLQDLGYDTCCAGNGAEAIQIYLHAAELGSPFDAVIIDLTIPGGMGGKETIRKLSEIDKEVKAIVASGYSTDPVMANYKEYGFKAVLSKPFNTQELREALRQVINNSIN